MKKKIISMALVASMAIGMLAGCGASESTTESTASVDETAENSSGDTEEPDHIIMTFLLTGDEQQDLQMVIDAVNEISIEKINVEVEVKPISVSDSFTNYSLWITAGEQVDLMCIAYQGINSYITSGQLYALDDLLENYGQYILELTEDYPLTHGAIYEDSVYGVTPVTSCYGFQGGFVSNLEVLEEIGYDEQDIYSLDDITDILASIKNLYPDSYPMAIMGSSVGSTATNYNYFYQLDLLGATSASGVLMSSESTTIENLYATDEYYEFLQFMRSWYEAGYISPDAATTDSLLTDLMSNKTSFMYPMNMQPPQYGSDNTGYGFATTGLPVTEGYFPSITASGNQYWTVPITSANPEAAIKFLNLMYEDPEIVHLLTSGIEGVHYVTNEDTDTTLKIEFPEGVDETNSTFYNSFGCYGDRRNEYSLSRDDLKEANETWTEQNRQTTYASYGYAYDTTNMQNEIIAVNTVLDQYLPALETGSVSDLENTYNQFIAALEAAGINDIIADNQAQFDAWLAEQ